MWFQQASRRRRRHHRHHLLKCFQRPLSRTCRALCFCIWMIYEGSTFWTYHVTTDTTETTEGINRGAYFTVSELPELFTSSAAEKRQRRLFAVWKHVLFATHSLTTITAYTPTDTSTNYSAQLNYLSSFQCSLNNCFHLLHFNCFQCTLIKSRFRVNTGITFMWGPETWFKMATVMLLRICWMCQQVY